MNKIAIKSILFFFFLCSLTHTTKAQGMRNITMQKFVPKGQWIVGSSVSYSQSEQKDYNFLVIESVSGEGYSFKISPLLCYAFADNMGAGGRFAYKRTLTKINQMDLEIGEDLNFSLNDVYSLSHSYSGVAMFRNYICTFRRITTHFRGRTVKVRQRQRRRPYRNFQQELQFRIRCSSRISGLYQ